MTAEIRKLTWRAEPRISYEALELLLGNLGGEASREVIARAVCDLSERMEKLRQALADGHPAVVHKIAPRLISISAQIGLTEFSGVASDLVRCMDAGDANATCAVAARLMRLSDISMFHAVQFAEATGG